MGDAVPDDVRKLLTEHVRSLMALELLLLVCAQGEREWSALDLERELRSSREWTDLELRHLVGSGLITAIEGQPPRFRCHVHATDAKDAVAWLAKSYPERRFSIIQVLYPPAPGPIQSFADAFKIRKERRDG